MASTTLTSWALLIWETLHAKGIDPRPLFKKAGLDHAILGDGNARYPVEKLFTLWCELENLEDPNIGVAIGLRWNPTTFHALGFAWLASNSLKDALQRLTRYCSLVNNSLHASFHSDGANYRIQISTNQDQKLVHLFAADAAAAAIVKMCRMLCGEQFSPMEAHLQRQISQRTPALEDLLRCPFHYNCEHAAWQIDRLDVERRIPGGNSELARINETIAAKALARLNKSDVSGRVKHYIMETLPSGAVEEEHIAEQLNMSIRSLQRKLGEEGLTFSKMVAEIRESLGMHYINETHLSLNEIGYLLGFSEQASFTRAFKRWTGKSPSQYRKQSSFEVA